jgi:hypothetical protein
LADFRAAVCTEKVVGPGAQVLYLNPCQVVSSKSVYLPEPQVSPFCNADVTHVLFWGRGHICKVSTHAQQMAAGIAAVTSVIIIGTQRTSALGAYFTFIFEAYPVSGLLLVSSAYHTKKQFSYTFGSPRPPQPGLGAWGRGRQLGWYSSAT